MAIINIIENTASVVYNGDTITSLPAVTTLLLPPLIVKTVDKLIASVGETLTYTILITNVALGAITSLPFTDQIPPGAEYVDETFTLNGSPATPTLTNDTLSFTIPNIGTLGIATITFQVEVVGGEI